MVNQDFRDIILSQKKGKEVKEWEGTVVDYLNLVKKDSSIASFAPGRIYNAIMKKGISEVDSSFKTQGYEDLVAYNAFKDKIFGDRPLEAIHDLMKFMKASARRTETGKRILLMMGPVASGKSTIAGLIKRVLEQDDTPKYVIADCPIFEEPMHLIPMEDRPFWEKELGIKIEGFLCPSCQYNIDNKYTDKNGVVNWEDIPVKLIHPSEQKRVSIGTFQPSDPKCVSYNTLLLSNKGLLTFSELQNIYQAKNNESVNIDITVDSVDGQKKASKFFNNSIQKTLKINTNFGYNETVTEIHPLYVLKNGKADWCKAKNIKEGDYIGLKRGQMIFGNNDQLPEFKYNGPNPRGNNINMIFPSTLTPKLSKVLGYLTAEGSHDKYSMWFSNLSNELKNDFNQCFHSIFNIKPKTYERACSVSSIKLCAFLDSVCNIKHGAGNKDIPFIIRKASKNNILAFLEGMFWGDGTISTRKNQKSNHFKYASKSELLIDQLKIILLNFDIVSSKETTTTKGFVNFDLAIQGDDVLKLLKLIPSLYNKKTDDGDFINIKNSSNWDIIPNIEPLFKEILNDVREKTKLPIYKIDKISKYERYKSYSSCWSRKPRRNTVLSFLNELDKLNIKSDTINELTSIAKNNIIWLKVDSISDGGYQQVYDITVPETHSFCANGFINHNSQDVTELIGRINMSKAAMYGDTDPRAYQFDGELQVANGGMIEYIEILKADIKFHYVLISAAQEQLIKAPGFPQMYIDTLILSHTNQTEFDKFRGNKDNEALHDRMYIVKMPWNLMVSEEVKIYQKMIDESDFRDIHIAPHTLEIAAQFAILSRLTKSTKVSTLIQKMKLYDGEITSEFKKSEIDVKALREEGKRNGEGMSGISPRFIINALNVVLGQKEDKKCVNPIDMIRALRHNFEHSIGIEEENIVHYNNLLVGDKQSVAAEYKEVAKKEVNRAFLYAYEDQAEELFRRYMENVSAFCKKEKVMDSITEEYSDPDEKLMRSLEELIGIPDNSKAEFRNGIFVHKATAIEAGRAFKFDTYDPLREAIERKLMSDLKNVVNLSIATPTSTNPKKQASRDRAFKSLLKRGYCKNCANTLLAFVGEVLRKI